MPRPDHPITPDDELASFDLLPAPPSTTIEDSLDRDYEYHATFLAYSIGFTSRPATAEVEIKLRVPAAFRDAAEVLDRMPGVVGRVDVWLPIKR